MWLAVIIVRGHFDFNRQHTTMYKTYSTSAAMKNSLTTPNDASIIKPNWKLTEGCFPSAYKLLHNKNQTPYRYSEVCIAADISSLSATVIKQRR